jgi:hypothetical protein
MEASNYTFYLISGLDGSREFFTTKNNIYKFLYNNKHYKNQSKIKDLICSGEFDVEIIKTVSCSRKEAISELEIIKLNEIDKLQKNKSLEYGISNEIKIYNLLNGFKCNITKSKYDFSHFDFYDDKRHILFELKSLFYPLDKYPTSLMNTSKLIFDRIIFLFEYTNDNNRKELYYHIYNKDLNYKIDYIRAFNRLQMNEVIRVPNKLLKIVDNDFIKVIENIEPSNDAEILEFNKIIDYDKLQASYLSKKY